MEKINPILLPAYLYFEQEIDDMDRQITQIQAHIKFTIQEIRRQNPELEEK